ncbi:MAG: ATP-binding cassette domain-containing protein [Thermoleophilia bacterium]
MTPGPWGDGLITGTGLRLEGVEFVYPGGVAALDGIDLEVGPGDFVALMGSNGSGKSTLLKVITGLLEPTAGAVTVDGRRLTPQTFADIAPHVGYLFQDPNDQLFCATVADDIAYGPENLGLLPEEVERRAYWAASVCGVEELLSRPIHALSYGQKKRVALAGVLAMKPKILVLDEPTASLDPMAEGSLMRLLRHLNLQGLTVLMATHDVDLIPLYADRVALLRRGRLAVEGPLAEVFSQSKHLEGCDLRLPRISYLFDIFYSEDERPLTVGQARKALVRMVEQGRLDLVPILMRDVSGGI